MLGELGGSLAVGGRARPGPPHHRVGVPKVGERRRVLRFDAASDEGGERLALLGAASRAVALASEGHGLVVEGYHGARPCV